MEGVVDFRHLQLQISRVLDVRITILISTPVVVLADRVLPSVAGVPAAEGAIVVLPEEAALQAGPEVAVDRIGFTSNP